MYTLDKVSDEELDAELTKYYTGAATNADEPFVFPGLSLLENVNKSKPIFGFKYFKYVPLHGSIFRLGMFGGLAFILLGLTLGPVGLGGNGWLWLLGTVLGFIVIFTVSSAGSSLYKVGLKRQELSHVIRNLYTDNAATRNAYRSWVKTKYGIVLDNDALTESFKRNVFTLTSGVSYRQDKEYDMVSSIRELSKEEADAFYAPLREVV
jgi:hypothetical protein